MKGKLLFAAAISVVAAALVYGAEVSADQGDRDHDRSHDLHTATPIKHLVVIFNENVSFDHYFATYPNATNPPGEIRLHRRSRTRRG